jgi:hypothetical protein
MQRSIRDSGQDVDMLQDLLDQEKCAVGIDLIGRPSWTAMPLSCWRAVNRRQSSSEAARPIFVNGSGERGQIRMARSRNRK